MAFCVNCGSRLLETAAFCTECGSPIKKEEAPVEGTPVVSAESPSAAAPLPPVAESAETVPTPVAEHTADADLQAHVAEVTKAFGSSPSASDAPTSELPAAVEQLTPPAEVPPAEPVAAMAAAEPSVSVVPENPPLASEPVYTQEPPVIAPQVETVAPAPLIPVAPVAPAAAAKSGGGLKIFLIVFAVIAVIAVLVVGGAVYFGYDKLQEVKQSLGLSKSSGSVEGKATAADPCSLATKDEVGEGFGGTITSAVPHGNKCTYLIANSGNRGITAAVFSGDASTKFKLAVSGARAQPVDLAAGQSSTSGSQAAYAFGTLYFYQNDTFVTLYMSGAYAGADAQQKAAAIAQKMLLHM